MSRRVALRPFATTTAEKSNTSFFDRGREPMMWFESMFVVVLVVAADQVSKAVALSRRTASVVTGDPPLVSIRCMFNRRGVLAPFVDVRALLALWVATVGLAVLLLVYGNFNSHDVLGSIGV